MHSTTLVQKTEAVTRQSGETIKLFGTLAPVTLIDLAHSQCFCCSFGSLLNHNNQTTKG